MSSGIDPGATTRQIAMPGDGPGFLENLAYGAGDLSSNLLWGISGSFLMYYYTDVYRLPVGAVATLLLAVRVLDALVDPLVGYAIDASHGRLVRPLIRWLAIPFGGVAFLAFLPLPGSDAVKLGWAAATYLVFGWVYAGINTSYGALGNMTATTPQDRVVQGAFRMIGCQSGQLLIAVLTIPLVHRLGHGDTPNAELAGFPRYMALVGAVGAGLWLLTCRLCRIRIPPPPAPRSPGTILAALIRNRPWVVCNLGNALNFTNICAYASFAIYYARDVLHRGTAFGGTLLGITTVTGIVGAMLTSPVAARYGRKRTLILSLGVEACALCVVASRPGSLPVALTGLAVAGLASGLRSPFYFSMISDAIDYGTARTGVRCAGMAYAINSMVTKIAFAATGTLLALFLAWGQYDPARHTQSAALGWWVNAGYVLLPALSSSLAIAVMLFYPPDRAIEIARH
ncbi:glycoside-pentoside-hexuronide (GPH):cation symporter [Nguyenibacter vanlangensis]|uniref:Glycoside-pentoside-hexuronide (GPH):cation symporter n=1 Tax=Nguyenibacter vanlangensis TaxID=1216886 RepID=A0ABZ3D8F9_9PROT